jgi:hypothetical protein
MTNYCKIETIIVIPTYNIGDEFLFNDYNFFLKNNENYEINLIFTNITYITLSTEIIEVTLDDQNKID